MYRSTQSPKMDIIHHSSNVQDLGITKSSDCTFNARINSLSNRVGKMPAFMSKVHAGGIYRYLPAFTGIYRRLLTLLDFVTISTKLVYAIV